MRFSPNRKSVASASDRRAELRQAREAAPTLRMACPEAALVRVELAFQEAVGPAHTPQAFSVYPPAKAHFVYACPFGDCDGVYDLNALVLDAFESGKRRMRGKLICAGARARNGKSACPCELAMTYSIVVQGAAEAPGSARDSAE